MCYVIVGPSFSAHHSRPAESQSPLDTCNCPRLAGISIPLERRREIYAICRQHDMVIIEDDPYFYLQWDLEVNIMDPSPDSRNSHVSTCGGRPAGTELSLY